MTAPAIRRLCGALCILTVAALAAAPLGLIESNPAFAASGLHGTPQVDAPFAIFATEGHDRFSHLLFLAETGRDAADRGRKYRNLGAMLQKVGRRAESYRAYEAGALEGDSQSASIVINAFLTKRYAPRMLSALVSSAIVPKAMDGNISSNLLLADLVGSGRLKGSSFHTSTYWLERAAKLGSGTAQRKLAEAAELRGDISSAATYYARMDRTGSKLERALRQARNFYLGKGVKQRSKIALAWLSYAARLDAVAAGKLAARLVRQMPGSASEERLLEFAQNAGITKSERTGTTGPSARLAAATSPAERAAIVAELKTAADTGDGNAAIAVWHALTEDGAAAPELEPYLMLAAKAGSGKAIGTVFSKLLLAPEANDETAALLAVLQAAAADGSVEALTALGNLYATGGPVAPDEALSLGYFRAAADYGDGDAQLRIGLHFAQDSADVASIELARHYLESAASQGSVAAQAYLDQLGAEPGSKQS